ncbi:MAG: cupredoxin domain-containing protein [Nanoarchaeota archaeon]
MKLHIITAAIIVLLIASCAPQQAPQPEVTTTQPVPSEPGQPATVETTVTEDTTGNAPTTSGGETTTSTTTPSTTTTAPAAGATKEFDITARKWSFTPDTITVNKGERVILHVRSEDVTHGFSLTTFDVSETLTAGQTTDIEFVADKAGSFNWQCNVFCGTGHGGMKGTLIVK